MTDLSWLEEYGDGHYKGYDLTQLNRDDAYVTFKLEENLSNCHLYKKHVECLNCPYVFYEPIIDNVTFVINQVPNFLYRLSQNSNETLLPSESHICEIGPEFGEFGIYQVTANNENCKITIVKNAVSIAFPVLTVFLIYSALFLLLFGGIFIINKYVFPTTTKSENSGDTDGKKRVKSLDTFRGISIVIMIFVNYGAGGYPALEHAAWNGLHFADLVFPWFMWIMGACIPISLMSSFKKKYSNRDIFLNVLKRSIKLFCLGIFLGSGPYLECMRIFGVLQRFGICYLVVTTICLFLMKRDHTVSEHKYGKYFTDFLVLFKGWLAISAILILYLLILFLVAEGDCPKGYMGPGGYHDFGKYFMCTGGATGYIDRLILGRHVYPYPTSMEVFLGEQSFDPEGILGCLPSIFHVFIGVQAGVILQVYKSDSDRLIRWLVWSVGTGIIGGALCNFSKDDGIIPVNKNLWSLSFVFVTCCFAFFLLSICYYLIDVKNWWSGKPFLYAGMNAILLYVGHNMTYSNIPVRWLVFCGKEHATHFMALFENLWGTLFWVVVAYYWYTVNYFFTI